MDSKHAVENRWNPKSEMEEAFDDDTDDKVCVYETVINGRYIKQEPCDMEDEPGSIYNYVDIKEEIIEDSTVATQETELTNESTDNKMYINEIISMKDEIIEDTKIVIQETSNTTIIQENRLTFCEGCDEEYDLYCLKCPMLIRIFDSDNPTLRDDRVRRTLPKDFVDICQTPSGVGIVALRIIPKGVVFGPFQGLDSSKDDVISKLEDEVLLYIKDTKRLNWMQYIRRADQSSHQNLTPFLYENRLYYQSVCHIGVGNELLAYWEINRSQDTDDSYRKPQVSERLDDAYGCTLCCIGYNSIHHLTAHNFRCPEKGNGKDFCKGIIQCVFCKIYMDRKEYSDYHMDRCCDRNTKKYILPPCPLDTDKPELKDKYKCSMCKYSTSEMNNFKRYQQSNTDNKIYKCPHRTLTSYTLQKHLLKYRCDTCSKQFKSNRMLIKHLKHIHNRRRKKCKCPKCPFESFYWERMKEHLLNVHSGIKRFKCPRCAFKTSYKNTLKVHLRYHVDSIPIKRETCEVWNKQTLNRHAINNKTYSCSKCVYRTRYKSNIELHDAQAHDAPNPLKQRDPKQHLTVVHDEDKPFKCDLCPKTFKQKRSLIEHARNIHELCGKKEVEEKQYECRKCTYRTGRRSSFKRHVAAVHDGLKPYECPICPHKTTTSWKLKQHIPTHNEDKPFKCDLCPKTYKRKTSLTEHARNTHSKVEKRAYECPKCNYRTRRKSDLNRHAASVHDGLKPLACPICPHKTTTSFNLKQHVATHNEDKPFKCEACPKTFKLKASLTAHARNIHVVTGQKEVERKEYRCNKCEYRTHRKSHFDDHVASVHSTLKPFACPICPYKTSTSSNLKQHNATHNEDKPFKCNMCPKRFKLNSLMRLHARNMHSKTEQMEYECYKCDYRTHRKGSFKRHVEGVHEDLKPFACSLCLYKAKTSSNLKQHVATHTDDKSFKCDMCLRMFKCKDYLMRHARNIHSVTEKGGAEINEYGVINSNTSSGCATT